MRIRRLVDLLSGLLSLGLAAMTPAHAQPYFNCQYSPRCEAILNKQCEPERNLKDKITLVGLHNSAGDVERTWLVLAGLEIEYCGRLGARGSIVREFVNFRAKVYPKLYGGSCISPHECAEAFVKTTRERWERDDLNAKIKADLERSSDVAVNTAEPAQPAAIAPKETIAPESWETTTQFARPTRTTRTGTVSSN
jgi:hypothetical protein